MKNWIEENWKFKKKKSQTINIKYNKNTSAWTAVQFYCKQPSPPHPKDVERAVIQGRYKPLNKNIHRHVTETKRHVRWTFIWEKKKKKGCLVPWCTIILKLSIWASKAAGIHASDNKTERKKKLTFISGYWDTNACQKQQPSLQISSISMVQKARSDQATFLSPQEYSFDAHTQRTDTFLFLPYLMGF